MRKRPRESTIAGVDELRGTCASTAALLLDIREFSETLKLPEKLGPFVRATQDHQLLWYQEMLNALRDSKTPIPKTPEDGTRFICHTLLKIYPSGVDISYPEDLLEFYGLPSCDNVDLMLPDDDDDARVTNELKMRHKFLLVLETLPVNRDQVTDGVGFTVSVEVKQYHYLPSELLFLIMEHRKAWCKDEDKRAHELLNQINATEDYKIVEINKMEHLIKNYQIRLRGIDGIEARDELLKMVNGKCLKIDVYYLDDNGCCVGDVYCDGTFLQVILSVVCVLTNKFNTLVICKTRSCMQDKLMEKGFKWHPDPELAEWEKDAPGMESKEDVLAMEWTDVPLGSGWDVMDESTWV